MINKKILLAIAVLLIGTVGCFKDLDTVPLDPDVLIADVVYDDPAAYKQVLAKLYAGYAVSGQQGPAGQPDITGIDEGFGQYLRGFWYHQELSTDEAVIAWNDQTIKDFHAQTWSAADGFIYAFYSRVFYQVALVNEFLRETTDGKLDGRGQGDLKPEVQKYRAEARFLRALSYWHALDLFRNVPFGTEDDLVGPFIPQQIQGKDLFAYIEEQLKTIENELPAPRTNQYARADQAAAWMLLAKLYLNAEVYGAGNRYEDCLTYCEKVLNAGYQLEPDYQKLFLADNHTSSEIIFPIAFDGVNTRTYGGTTFIIRAGIGGTMDPLASGVVGGWGGTRTTRQFVEKFPQDLTGILVDYNEGSTVKYPVYYVSASHIGFDSAGIANSIKIGTADTINKKKYEGYIYFPNNNSEFHFRQLPSQSFTKYGDNNNDGKLEANGANIQVADAGLYYVKLDVTTSSNRTYSVEKRQWSIIGSATGNTDINFNWDAATGKLALVNVQLAAGTLRLRANQNDATSLGDTGADGLLDANGAEIQIPDDGQYTIYLDLDRPDYTYQLRTNSFDRRGKIYTDGQNIDIEDLSQFTDGYAINKFRNVTSTGALGSDTDYPDTDFPMFRLADAYLMAAEAILRGAGGGDKNKALLYVNKVRERAYSGSSGNFNANNLTLDAILDERARELYWECHRRTDLVRFGQFTNGTYLWQWKGGVKEGATVPEFRNIYPIPSNDLANNPNLNQNFGY